MTKRKKSIWWWILVGWWLYPTYYLLVWWWLTPLKKLLGKKQKPTESPAHLKTEVVGTTYFKDGITQWQTENNGDQWIGARYSEKRLYQYPYSSDVRVSLEREPHNEHDPNAIAVYLGRYKAGYISREDNVRAAQLMQHSYSVTADVYAGDSKYLDGYGDLILSRGDYHITLQIFRH